MKDFENNLEPANAPVNFVSGNVLLVESDVDRLELLSLYIRTIGMNVDVVSNGEQAVEMLLCVHYDLIIISISVTKEQAVVEILESKKHITPVVVIADNALFDSSEYSYLQDADYFLIKPVNRKRLHEVLLRCMPHSFDAVIPLDSSLLENEPELLDLIKKYVCKYPDMISELKIAFDNSDYKQFEKLLHDIKSTGGNFGFMLITELAVMITVHLNNDNNAVSSLLDELAGLHQRMELALQ